MVDSYAIKVKVYRSDCASPKMHAVCFQPIDTHLVV